MTIAIIGAGMAGLTCAGALLASGQSVVVFDKARGPGGRMSTRRTETAGGTLRFDHGVPAFHAEGESFRRQAEAWQEDGLVAPWEGRHAHIRGETLSPSREATLGYVGTPAMNSILKAQASDIPCTWSLRCTGMTNQAGAWHLSFEDGQSHGPFATVIVAIPTPQAVDLIQPIAPDWAKVIGQTVWRPAWTLMIGFQSAFDPGFDVADVSGHELGWIGHQASKPGRDGAAAWVAHAHADFVKARLESPQPEVCADLVHAFRRLTGAPEPLFATAHRWRYAQPESSVRPKPAYMPDLALGVCGDWQIGNTVEAAWTSGRQLAAEILATVDC